MKTPLDPCPVLPDRASGVLMHISSLPGALGTGTLGREAEEFVEFLCRSGQRYWQVLPLNPVCPHWGFSPYSSPASSAGNEWLISLERMVEEGYLPQEAAVNFPRFPETSFIDFPRQLDLRRPLLEEAAGRFLSQGEGDRAFHDFCQENRDWLENYALFMALAEDSGTYHWPHWEREAAFREPAAMELAAKRFEVRLHYYRFVQYLFDSQWKRIQSLCHSLGIRLIGDIPFYVSLDSADVWAQPDIFLLDEETFEPLRVAGVPPDYFNADGQRWGNPLYRWFLPDGQLNRKTAAWWSDRIRHAGKRFDLVRLDHFRGFSGYWSIPASSPTAREGKWETGPGDSFFQYILQENSGCGLIAEDLGMITPDVNDLRERFSLPGMRILQFAFDGDPNNPHLPENYPDSNCLVYTGTHDNNTTRGWYESGEVGNSQRISLLNYLGIMDDREVTRGMIGAALESIAFLSVFPMQDILNLPGEMRMNIPGTPRNNWRWKMRRKEADAEPGRELAVWTRESRRSSASGISPVPERKP